MNPNSRAFPTSLLLAKRASEGASTELGQLSWREGDQGRKVEEGGREEGDGGEE